MKSLKLFSLTIFAALACTQAQAGIFDKMPRMFASLSRTMSKHKFSTKPSADLERARKMTLGLFSCKDTACSPMVKSDFTEQITFIDCKKCSRSETYMTPFAYYPPATCTKNHIESATWEIHGTGNKEFKAEVTYKDGCKYQTMRIQPLPGLKNGSFYGNIWKKIAKQQTDGTWKITVENNTDSFEKNVATRLKKNK